MVKGNRKKASESCKSGQGRAFFKRLSKNEAAGRFYIREGFSVQAEKTDEDTGEAELSMVWKRGNL